MNEGTKHIEKVLLKVRAVFVALEPVASRLERKLVAGRLSPVARAEVLELREALERFCDLGVLSDLTREAKELLDGKE